MAKSFIITIDGPAAAGKGTIAYLLSRRYGFMDIDSGAIYRAMALIVRRAGLVAEPTNEVKIVSLLDQHKITLVHSDIISGRMGVMVDREDVSEVIRTEELTNLVPGVSALAGVRKIVASIERELATGAQKGAVIEGRDTGTTVFPEAQLKIFLTATPEERAQRRHAEFIGRGKTITFEEVYSDLMARDIADIERTLSPLTKAKDAIVIDSTGMMIEEVLEKLSGLIDERIEKHS
jgi:cytidylate kinase